MNTAVANAEASLFVSGTAPKTALSQAQANATKIIQAYNQRLGLG